MKSAQTTNARYVVIFALCRTNPAYADLRKGARKIEAKQYLGQLEKLELLINNKLIEKEQWRDLALNITGNMDGERVQSSEAKSKMAEAIEKCILVENEIDALIDRLIDKKKEVIAMIEQLDKPVEYDILHRLYIQKQTLQEVADHYHKEYGWATTLHGRALKSLQEVLDNRRYERWDNMA